MSEIKTRYDGSINKNVERVSALPEEYIVALEEIVDSFDKDWRNRMVYSQYINYMCDEFEAAIAQGKHVEEVVGSDKKAYAKQLELKLDLKTIEPTKHNKCTNYLIVMDFIIYVGLAMIANITSFDTTSNMMFSIIGMIVILVGFFLKYQKIKSIGMKPSFLAVQYILSLLIVILVKGTAAGGIVGFALAGSDYVLVSNYFKNHQN